MKKIINKEIVEKFNIDVDSINATGFTWEKFISLIPWPFLRFICSEKQDRIAETARFTGKTFVESLDTLWHLITFWDYNAIVGRWDFKTHKNTTWVAFNKVARMLTKNDVDLSWLSWIDKKDEMLIKFNGRSITFDSIGKFNDSALGMEFLQGGLGKIWVDEASKPPKESSIIDIGKDIYENADQILGSAIRGSYSGNGQIIPQFSAEVPMINENGEYVLDSKNGKEFPIFNERTNKIEMLKFKTEIIHYRKRAHLDFSLNGWDPSNHLHETYFEDLWELTYELEQNILQYNSSTFEDKDKDCFLMRASSWMAKACGYMSHQVEEYLKAQIKKNPNKAKGIVLGYVVEDDDLSKYTYRNNLDNVKIIDLKSTLKGGTIKLEDGNYPINHLVFGLDWGFSKIKAKNSAITCTGFSRWNDGWEAVIALKDWKAVTKSNKVDGEDIKIKNAAAFIFENYNYWKDYLSHDPIVWYDLQDKIAARQVQIELVNLGLDIKFLAGAKHEAKKWGIPQRQLYFQNLLSSGRFFIDPSQSKLLWKELYDSKLANDSLIADKRSKNDATTALGYSFSMMRYSVKTSSII